MQNNSYQTFDQARLQENRSIFSCWSCIGNEQEGRSQINPDSSVYQLRKSRQTKRSLKNANHPSSIIVPFQSELTLAKSNVNKSPLSLENNSEKNSNKIYKIASDRPTQVKDALIKKSSEKQYPELMPIKIMSLRSTNATTLKSSSTIPKISFFYNHQQNLKQVPKSNSTIPEQPLTPIPVLERKICSQVKVDLSILQSEIQVSKSGDQIIDNASVSENSSLTSPLNKLYKTAQKEMLVSLQFRKKSSKNSIQNSQKHKIRRLPSLNEPFSKAAMKVRQTVSIKQPQEESDMMSVVITNSLLNSFNGLLIPIDETEMETRLSEYRD